MRGSAKKPNISFKCHYCGKGSDKTMTSHRITGTSSKSLEKDRRLVSGNLLNRSKSVHTTYLPPLNQTTDFTYIPGRTLTEDDLREELIQIKKRYTALNREHGLLKTHLRVASNDLKRREQEIENLLQDPITLTKSQEQLELNSLKRKMIQYERALREKTQEINNLLGDKNIFNATETHQKMKKLEEDLAKLRHRLVKSVPYVEIEAERTKLAEMIETLQRENEELHHMIEAIFQEGENNSLLNANGMKDPKMLAKLREEAAARRSEVEHYQRALSSLIREKSLPSILMSPKHVVRSISAKSKNTERIVSAKSDRQNSTVPNSEKRKTVDSKKNILKPIKKSASTEIRSSSTTKKVVESDSKSKARVERSEKRSSKSGKNGKIVEGDSVKQPVKHVNQLMNYEETESSAKSPDLLTPAESAEEKVEKKKRKNHGASSIASDYDDDDSNIEAINEEYQEKETDDRIGSLITALRCQLLREEMIQTRVMSF